MCTHLGKTWRCPQSFTSGWPWEAAGTGLKVKEDQHMARAVKVCPTHTAAVGRILESYWLRLFRKSLTSISWLVSQANSDSVVTNDRKLFQQRSTTTNPGEGIGSDFQSCCIHYLKCPIVNKMLWDREIGQCGSCTGGKNAANGKYLWGGPGVRLIRQSC